MNKFLSVLPRPLQKFVREEEGAQVIEYALIIAVVSLALIVALQGVTTGDYATFITRLKACLSTGACGIAAAG